MFDVEHCNVSYKIEDAVIQTFEVQLIQTVWRKNRDRLAVSISTVVDHHLHLFEPMELL